VLAHSIEKKTANAIFFMKPSVRAYPVW